MKYFSTVEGYILRFEVGDEIFSVLKNFADEKHITLAEVTGIGAANKVQMGVYDLKARKYNITELSGDMEIVSLNGNISTKDGESYVHLHISVGDSEARLYGGHLLSAVVSITAEVFVKVFTGEIERCRCEKTGANILNIK